MLTISDQDGDVMEAIFAGAWVPAQGRLRRGRDARNPGRGGRRVADLPTIAGKVLSGSARHRVARSSGGDQSRASDREIEVLKLIANGKDNAQIAADLHISPKTVKNHISNILMKLRSRTAFRPRYMRVCSGIV